MSRLMGSGNIRSSLKPRKRQGDPMAAYDQLPPPLRGWLAQAVLPWSARSALRVWQRALDATGGNIEDAIAQMKQREIQTLKRDRFRIWDEHA